MGRGGCTFISVENCVTICYNRRSKFEEEMSREMPHACVTFFDGGAKWDNTEVCVDIQTNVW